MRLPLAAALAFGLACAGTQESRPLRVAVLGDRAGGHTPGVFSSIVDEVNHRRPDVVLAVGDLIEGNTKDADRIREQWREVLPKLRKVRAPLLLCPGNHDVFSKTSEAIYTELMGPLYQAQTIAGVHFYLLDVSRAVLPERIDEAQWKWLIQELGRTPGRDGKVVVMHRPLWFHTLAAGRADALHDLFVREGVDLAVAGHEHKYFYAEYDGVRYVSVGPSGGSFFFWGPGEHQFHQFLWVTIDDGAFDIGVVKSGEVLPADITTLREAKLGHAVHARGLTASDVRFGPGGASDTVVAEVRSLGGSAPEGTLRWDVPQGWTVSPCSLPFAVSRRETIRCAFAVAGRRPWPAPVLNGPYQYGRNHVADLKVPVRVVRELPCLELSDSLAVDGRLDPAWRTIESEDLLYVSARKEAPAGVASFRFGHHGGALYVWATCASWEGKPPQENPRGGLKRDDVVFVTLQPGGQGPVYRMTINGAGDVDMFAGGAADWECDFTLAVNRSQDSWDGELSVQLDCMQGAEARGTWGLNFGRRHPVHEMGGAWMETAQWMIRTPADSTGLGRLLFED